VSKPQKLGAILTLETARIFGQKVPQISAFKVFNKGLVQESGSFHTIYSQPLPTVISRKHTSCVCLKA